MLVNLVSDLRYLHKDPADVPGAMLQDLYPATVPGYENPLLVRYQQNDMVGHKISYRGTVLGNV